MAVIEQQEKTDVAQAPAPVDKNRQSEKKQIQFKAVAEVTRKKMGWINSPWLLVATLLAIGGFWLVQHPQVIIDHINQPYALLAGPALVGSVLAGWLIIKFFAAIERACKAAARAFLAARKEDGSAQFFWIVIMVFLTVSVFASGDFFSKLEREAVPGLGYATALFIDLVTIQCMRARLNAGRLRDRAGQFLYLLGVLVCACASAFANVYTSLSTFTDQASGALPPWATAVAPWFGLVFPFLIVLLSMTADYTVDQTSSRLDPEHYKTQEDKRVKLLEIQRDLLRQRVVIEGEIDELMGRLRSRKERRVFFLWAWLFPVQHSQKRIVEEAAKIYEPRLAITTQQNEWLRRQLIAFTSTTQSSIARLDQGLQKAVRTFDDQRDLDNRLLMEEMSRLNATLRTDFLRVVSATFIPDRGQFSALESAEIAQNFEAEHPQKTGANPTGLSDKSEAVLGKEQDLESKQFVESNISHSLHNLEADIVQRVEGHILGDLPHTQTESIEVGIPPSNQDNAIYVELPGDPNEDGPATTHFEAIIGMRGHVENSYDSAPVAAHAPIKEVTGLTYREAAKLPACAIKGIRAGDIRAAVKSRALGTYRDGSVSRSAVERWVKTAVDHRS